MEAQETGSIRPDVLVVDDDRERANRYADALAGEYTVRIANSGDSAVEMLSADVNVAIINQTVGDTTGEDVLESARTRGFTGRGVLLTANPALEPIGKQFDDFLTTPVSTTDVVDVVERMLDRAAFDTSIQEVLSLVSRMSTLESRLSIEELGTNDTYARLEARLDEYRKRGVDMGDRNHKEYAEFSSEKLRVVLGS